MDSETDYSEQGLSQKTQLRVRIVLLKGTGNKGGKVHAALEGARSTGAQTG